MNLEPLRIEGAWRLRPERRGDERGHLERLFDRERFRELGLKDCSVEVSEVANPRIGTLRGLHFQRSPHGETKLIRVVRGAVFDVLVDVRPASPTYGQWQGFELSAGDGCLIYAPAGLAHGYLTLSDDSAMLYFMDTAYVADHAAGVHYADPDLAIDWPAKPAQINARDLGWPMLANLIL